MKTTELKKALETVKPGLASKEIIEQSTSFAFMKDKVVTYNDEISIQYPLPDLQMEGAVKADELYSFLSKVTKDEIEITENNKGAILKCGRAVIGLTVQSKVKLPLDELNDKKTWTELTDEYNEALQFCVSACGSDMLRPILTCVHVQEDRMEASDGFKIVRWELEKHVKTDGFLLPAQSVLKLSRFRPTKISTSKNWVHFKNNDNAVFSCRVFNENFPDLMDLLTVEGEELKLPNTTLEILERAWVFAKRDFALDEKVLMSFEKNRMTMRSNAETGSWFKEHTNMKFNKEKIAFNIHPYLLKDILKKTNVCVICEDRMKFEGPNWVYVGALEIIE